MYKLLSGAKSVKQYRGDENLPEAKNGMKKNCGCKHTRSKYKYGTGAITIPEGSAIVTANGGKNMQALKAYKKGNYKLLNKIIDGMPEDRVDKAQTGKKNTTTTSTTTSTSAPSSTNTTKNIPITDIQVDWSKNPSLPVPPPVVAPSTAEQKRIYDIYDDRRIAEKFGQKYDVDKPKYRSSLSDGKLNLKEDTQNVNYRNQLRNNPAYFEKELKAGNVQIDDNGNITYTAKGKFKQGKKEFLGTSSKKNTQQGGQCPPGGCDGGGISDGGEVPNMGNDMGARQAVEETPLEENKTLQKKGKKSNISFPSMAEVIARGSILRQGVEGVPENYLKLGRYQYVSPLDRILRENTIAANTAKENLRNVVGGSAASYISSSSDIAGKRFDQIANVVSDDALKKNALENENVNLGNIEAQTNRSLKDQYAMQRAANRGAYNNQLIALGQSIDTTLDAAKLMKSQRDVDDVRTNLLKSQNYYMDPQGNIRMSKKGIKKVKTYKRK